MQQTKTPIEVLASQRATARRVGGDSLACLRGGRPVFSDLSFAVETGEALALTGANGAGKTSLLRILAGLLAPAAGQVIAQGFGEGGLREAAHYLGHRDALKPALSLRENLAFWRAMLGGESDVVAALDAVGLGHGVDLPAGVLSAGQRRRLSFARLVAIKRPVWLLDEPLAALDAAGQDIAVKLMHAHCAGGGIVIAATHGPLGIPARDVRLGTTL